MSFPMGTNSSPLTQPQTFIWLGVSFLLWDVYWVPYHIHHMFLLNVFYLCPSHILNRVIWPLPVTVGELSHCGNTAYTVTYFLLFNIVMNHGTQYLLWLKSIMTVWIKFHSDKLNTIKYTSMIFLLWIISILWKIS